MPFHDYSSSVSLHVKAKDQAFRHSSPPGYSEFTNDLKPGNNEESTVKTNLLPQEDAKNAAFGIKSRRVKGQKTPFRSNSNPVILEDFSKTRQSSFDDECFLSDNKNGQTIGITNPNFVENTTKSSKRKKSPIPQRKIKSFSNGSLPANRVTTTTATKSTTNKNHIADQSAVTNPTIVVNKPPVPTSVSPLASVKLRPKPTGSPKGSRRRQGFVLDSQATISSPVLISHEVGSGEAGVKLRDLEQQEQLLNNLQIKSVEKAKKAEKSNNSTPDSNSPGARMAERIQRTIKALYTSNPSTKKGYSIQEQLIAEEEFQYSDGSASPELKGRPPKYRQLETSSPKSDKRSTRKRSPKPSQKNNLQVKDVDGSRRFKWRGSVNKIVKKFGTGQPFVLNGTFGVHLEDCPPSPVNEFVPFIVELCCRVVEDRGLRFTGIYRVPGNNASLSALQEDLNNRGAESIQPDDERLRDLNIVSSLLKSFFRKLPEPLFTNELYHDFIQANRQQMPENRLNCLRKLVHMLPGPHYETLKFLISHLRLIADNCEWNKMEVRNLAIVFGPTLVRNTAADNTATMVTDMSDQCRIIESIIDHAEWFFSDTVDTIPEIAQSVPAEGEREAVPSIEFLLDNVGRKPGDTGTTESGKSKGSDDSENSFSRDLMDLLFGKKWKQSANANNQSADVDDDGGFGDYRSKKQDGPVPKKEQVVSGDVVVTEVESPKLTQDLQPLQSSIPNVTERLMDFYREHLERLSQTTVGQTLPTFSSADSSPRTTPRHSTVFTAPLIFPPQDNIPRGNRSRVSSDSQDPRYFPPAYEMPPKVPPHANRIPAPEVVSRSISAPQYKHPPNPYRPGRDSFNPKPPVLESPPSSSLPAVTRPTHDVVPKPRENIAKTAPHEPPSSPTRKKTSSKPSSRKPSHSENIPYVDEHMQHYPQIEPSVTTEDMPVNMIMDENCPPVTINERLVDELPQPVYTTSPISLRSRKSSSTSPEPPVSKPRPAARSHSKKSSAGSVGAITERPVQKRRKSPLKENFSPPLVTTATASDKLFSRYDPKRRGIRFAGTENANTSPKKQQLSATERLFNGQPLRRKPSSRENRRNKVIRRHTLSGIQDLQEHSPSLKFKSNLQQASMGQNLSMYDLASASANGQRSAMERLNPKGATSGMTLSNWMVQERLRSKTVESNGSPGNSVRRQKEQGQFRSYV